MLIACPLILNSNKVYFAFSLIVRPTLNELPYRRPGNFDDNPRNSFQIRNPNHSSKPNNKGKAEQRPRTPFRPPKEKRRNNKEIEYPAFDVHSDVYQDDPPPLIRPPSPGTRRNPEVCNKLARETYDGHRVYAVWHYRGYKIRKFFAKKSRKLLNFEN